MVNIPWNDGTNQYLYIDFDPLLLGGNIIVASDTNNSGITRKRVIIIESLSDSPNAKIYLVIEQNIKGDILISYDNIVSLYENVKAIN